GANSYAPEAPQRLPAGIQTLGFLRRNEHKKPTGHRQLEDFGGHISEFPVHLIWPSTACARLLRGHAAGYALCPLTRPALTKIENHIRNYFACGYSASIRALRSLFFSPLIQMNDAGRIASGQTP